MLLLHNKHQQQYNPIASLETVSAGKALEMSELQAHYCMTPEQLNEPGSCAM